MSRSGWYLRCRAEDLGERAILVGDRSRVQRAAKLLDAPRWVNEDRGLTTVTGTYRDQLVSVCAFGMGAPVAAVVLHELASLGVHTALRLGTVMSLRSDHLGRLVLAEGAMREEATSDAYAPRGFPAVPDPLVTARLSAELAATDHTWLSGVVASYDAFYRDMFALSPHDKPRVDEQRVALADLGVVAVDMETSAVLTVGRTLGVRAASLCLATVDAATGTRLDDRNRQSGERRLLGCGLHALTAADDEAIPRGRQPRP